MAPRGTSKSTTLPSRPLPDLDDYGVEDLIPPSAGEASKGNKSADTQSRKRKDASGLGIDEAVSVDKKPRVPRVKLDEKRLLSEEGIPRLQRKAKGLKFKGKGHEFSDAARLLSLYQLWLDDLFPKAKFVDALNMVEKAGHKGALRLKRTEWLDEGKPRPAKENDNDDLFGGLEQPEERDPAVFPARLAPIFSNTGSEERAKTPVRDDVPDEEDIYGATPRRPRNTTAGESSSVFGNGGNTMTGDAPDEDDLDALMAEAEAQRTEPASMFGNGKTARTYNEPDEDDLDALMAEAEAQRTESVSIFGNGKAKQTHNEPDEDDLDALMAEAEAESSTIKPAKSVTHRPTGRNIVDDDEDDLDALMAEAEAEAHDSSANKGPSHEPSMKPAATMNHGIDDDEEAAMAEMDGLW